MPEHAPQLTRVAIELLNLGKSGHSIDAFFSESMLRPIRAGMNHLDRQRVYKTLLSEGCIREVDGRFWTQAEKVPAWVMNAYSEGFGDPESFKEQLLESPESKAKFDAQLLAQIGLNGELSFVDFLSTSLSPEYVINHVSLVDDSLGYDVEVISPNGNKMFFEVKTSTRRKGKFRFFVSRNEFSVGLSLGNTWNLAFMSLIDGQANLLGKLEMARFENLFPADRSKSVVWQSAKCSVEFQELDPFDPSSMEL